MVSTEYTRAVRGVIDHLEKTQLEAVEKAAQMVSKSLTSGGAVRCHGIGHGTEGDFINRAGGLAAVQGFSFGLNINDPGPDCHKDRPRKEPFDRELETVRFALKASNMRSGDVMLLGSVSGKSRGPVELAIACREMGIKVIGLTAMAYTTKVKALHPSGKRLFEVVDVVIDIGAPYGDAAVTVPGFAEKMLPVSGVAMTIAGWMIWGRVMEVMAAAGTSPSVFISINREDGKAYYDKSKAEYNSRGY